MLCMIYVIQYSNIQLRETESKSHPSIQPQSRCQSSTPSVHNTAVHTSPSNATGYEKAPCPNPTPTRNLHPNITLIRNSKDGRPSPNPNPDINRYQIGVEPEASFELTETRLVARNNELGFQERDLKAPPDPALKPKSNPT